MALFEKNTAKRRRNRYRLVIMNDDTFEEVVKFKLTRLTVYVAFCSIFVLLVGLTVALIAFTDIKYYLPGYGTLSQKKQLQQLKIKTDSLERELNYSNQYLNSLQKVLSGEVVNRDTAVINDPRPEKTQD